MKCPECGKPAEVLQTRDMGKYMRRRYECFNSHRFSTMEQVHVYRPSVLLQTPEDRNRDIVEKIKELLK